MNNALCEFKGVEGNDLIPYYYYYYYYYYSICYDYYSTIFNTVYCLLDTRGATCGSPPRRHTPEPSLASENVSYTHIYIYISASHVCNCTH